MGWLGVAESLLEASRPGLPVVDRARCLAVRHPGTACDRCAATCPTGAIERESRPRVDAGRCDECGVCAAACPTGALESSAMRGAESRWLASIGPGTEAWIRCERAGDAAPAGATRRVPCVAAVHPSDLVVAAVRGASAIHLRTGACRACPRGTIASTIPGIAETARNALAAMAWPATAIDLVNDGEACSPGPPLAVPMSRRGLFRLTRGQARRAAVDLARGTESIQGVLRRPGPVPGWRTRLQHAFDATRGASVTGRAMPLSIGAGLVRATERCDGCGLCVLACPHGALSVGSGRPEAAVEACTACGVCAEVCPMQALSVEPAELARLRRPEARLDGRSAAAPGPDTPAARADAAPGPALLEADRLRARATASDAAMREAARRTLAVAARETRP